jgi:hypothetical protein
MYRSSSSPQGAPQHPDVLGKMGLEDEPPRPQRLDQLILAERARIFD